MTVNGVTLPDIPEGVLESFPYAFIALRLGTAEGVAIYELWASENETIQCNGRLLWLAATDEEYGYRGYYYQVGDSTDWIPNGASDSGTESTLWLPSGNYSIAWSNHDIWTVTAQDEVTGELTYGDLYFAKTGEEISAVRYSIAGSILDDIAKAIQIQKKTTRKYKPEEFAKVIRGFLTLPADSAETTLTGLKFNTNAVGILPTVYKGTATSTMTGLSFATSAAGELTE